MYRQVHDGIIWFKLPEAFKFSYYWNCNFMPVSLPNSSYVEKWMGELDIIMQMVDFTSSCKVLIYPTKRSKKNMVLVSLMATSFSVVNWLSSPSINKVDTYIHRQELKLLKQGDKFFPYLSLGLFSSLISRLWNPFLFIWVFFCKFAFRVERIKRKERKTSYSAVFLFLEINGWNTQN